MRFLFNLFQLYIVFKLTFMVLRFMFRRKFGVKSKGKYQKYGKKRVSLLGKVWLLISRQLHSSLDGKLRQQSIALREKREMQKQSLVKQSGVAQQDSKEKVIEFKKYQRKQVR
jgi:hypothetical protein